jgi:hypothetical protein
MNATRTLRPQAFSLAWHPPPNEQGRMPGVLARAYVQDSAGTVLVELFHVPMNPNVVVPLAGSAPLYDMFVTVTEGRLLVRLPFHSWATVCPFANVQPTRQLEIAVVPARTVISAWKPPGY